MIHCHTIIIGLIVLVSLTNGFGPNSTNTTGDPHYKKKPTNKPLVSPINLKKPVYNYPTIKPVYKYPTKKPFNSKPPTVKPMYTYPSKRPANRNPSTYPVSKYPTKMPQVYPTDSPSSVPSKGPSSVPSTYPTSSISRLPTTEPATVIPSNIPTESPSDVPTVVPIVLPTWSPSIDPSFMPSDVPISRLPTTEPTTAMPSNVPSESPSNVPTVVPIVLPTWSPSIDPSFMPSNVPAVLSCSCNKYNASGNGPDVVLCWNSTKPNEYFGVYNATDTLFTTNRIIKNPSFPASSDNFHLYGKNIGCSFTYDNVRPLNDNGVLYLASNDLTYEIGYKDFGQGFNFIIDSCDAKQERAVDQGPVACPNNLLIHQETGILQGTSETELITTNNDSKIIIGVVVSIILTVFFAAAMFALYHKYIISNNMKENKDYDLEIFYNSTINNYENRYYSNNPMDSVSLSEQYDGNKNNNEASSTTSSTHSMYY